MKFTVIPSGMDTFTVARLTACGGAIAVRECLTFETAESVAAQENKAYMANMAAQARVNMAERRIVRTFADEQ